ncbi:ABC-F family ATP-binding cassette domain-containing protein [Alphaproteobacteria bacterium]|nr:ABC-F family ATP-binding cassette domain-containing protein [Alphaproteobacteria bacterium]
MTIPLISIKNLVVTIADKKLVNEVDFSIHQYDRIILVGENGSGKSTLLKIIKGITEPEKGIIWKKPNIKIEYLEQNPIFPLVDNMMDFLSFGLQHPNISKINEIIEELSLQNIDFSQKLSGGEIRKIFIAKAFLKEPDVILLDEPTNHIDLPTIFWLENKLLNLNTTMILISHDHDFLNKIGNKTYWLHNGKLRKRDGEYKGFFEWSESLMEIDKNQNHKIKQKIKNETKWSVEGISGRRKRNMGRVKELEKLNESYSNSKINYQNSFDISLNKTTSSGSNIIEAVNLSFAFKDSEIIKNFDYKIKRNDRIGIIGANGSGKTTLIKLLQGIYNPTNGKVKLGERLNIKYFDQNKEAIDLDSSPWKTLSPKGDHVEFDGKKIHILSYLKKFLFDEKKSMQKNSTLSGGEKVRLLLCKLFLNEHNFLILDEPTNDLDFETLNLLKDNIKNYDGTVLIISHDRYFLDQTISKLLVFENDNSINKHEGNFSDYYLKYGFEKLKKIKNNLILKKSNLQNKIQAKNLSPKIKLSFKNSYDLKVLPDKIKLLEIELYKLETLLDNQELYKENNKVFNETIIEVSKKKNELSAAEDKWLELQILVENIKS